MTRSIAYKDQEIKRLQLINKTLIKNQKKNSMLIEKYESVSTSKEKIGVMNNLVKEFEYII